TTSNVICSRDGKFAVAPALEEVALWDLKKGILKRKWLDINNKAEVTAIVKNPKNDDYAVGQVFFMLMDQFEYGPLKNQLSPLFSMVTE
ncbi:15704_t:CDS:2, partial [Racocetra persica]